MGLTWGIIWVKWRKTTWKLQNRHFWAKHCVWGWGAGGRWRTWEWQASFWCSGGIPPISSTRGNPGWCSVLINCSFNFFVFNFKRLVFSITASLLLRIVFSFRRSSIILINLKVCCLSYCFVAAVLSVFPVFHLAAVKDFVQVDHHPFFLIELLSWFDICSHDLIYKLL